MKCATLMLIAALLTGCGVQDTDITDSKRGERTAADFSRVISTGSNRDITRAITNFFRVAAPCSQYESVFALADSKHSRDFGYNYVFRFRPTAPQEGGDLWVEVGVDDKSQTLKYVRPDGYKLGFKPNQ